MALFDFKVETALNCVKNAEKTDPREMGLELGIFGESLYWLVMPQPPPLLLLS